MIKAKTAFEFYTSSQLVEITGKKAANLNEFLETIKVIDESSLFYHVHHAFREHQFAPGIYTNDFAHWVEEELKEKVLAERLANINLKEFTEIRQLREKIVEILENYLNANLAAGTLPAKHQFYFCKSIAVVLKTKDVVWSREEFCAALMRVGLRSLFFHFFEARLRLGRQTNDFSDWINGNFGDEKTAKMIEGLDPYMYSMDELRDQIIKLVQGKKDTLFSKVKKWLKIKLKNI